MDENKLTRLTSLGLSMGKPRHVKELYEMTPESMAMLRGCTPEMCTMVMPAMSYDRSLSLKERRGDREREEQGKETPRSEERSLKDR